MLRWRSEDALLLARAESVKYCGLQSGDEGGVDGRFSPFFVADILKLALEEGSQTFRSWHLMFTVNNIICHKDPQKN